MKIPKQISAFFLMIILAAIACTFPTTVNVTSRLIDPTDAPTSAPNPAIQLPAGNELIPTATLIQTEGGTTPTPESGPQGEDIVIEGTGMYTSFGPSPEVNCQTDVFVKLIVRNSGEAQLTFTGPNWMDHYNCTLSGFDETWTIIGDNISWFDEIVSFTSCNEGGFAAYGNVIYKGGKLSGEVDCSTQDQRWMRLVLGGP